MSVSSSRYSSCALEHVDLHVLDVHVLCVSLPPHRPHNLKVKLHCYQYRYVYRSNQQFFMYYIIILSVNCPKPSNCFRSLRDDNSINVFT